MEVLHLENVLWAVVSAGLRISALILFAPFFNSQAIPTQVKAALTGALTMLLYPITNLSPQALYPLPWKSVPGENLQSGLSLRRSHSGN